MKSLKQWISFLCILFIWIFSFKISEIYWEHKNFSDKKVLQICLTGLFILLIIYNTDYITPR